MPRKTNDIQSGGRRRTGKEKLRKTRNLYGKYKPTRAQGKTAHLLLAVCVFLPTVCSAHTVYPPTPTSLTCSPGHFKQYARIGRRRRGRVTASCISCGPGTYMPLYNHKMESCVPCSSGLWTQDHASTQCKGTAMCPTGKWGVVGSQTPPGPCQDCAAGRVQPHPGQPTCHLCPSGTYSNPAKTTCLERIAGGCPAGKYGPLGTSSLTDATCVICPPDSYSAFPGSGACTVCPPQTQQPLGGQVSCSPIPECSHFTTWSGQPLRSCILIHAHVRLFAALVWTTWVATILIWCCYHGPLFVEDVPNTSPCCRLERAWAILYNFFAQLCIGIEITRHRGIISDKAFWSMVGFSALGAVAVCLFTLAPAISHLRARCKRTTPPVTASASRRTPPIESTRDIVSMEEGGGEGGKTHAVV